ncbi:hypothetical protein ACEPAH_3766 [Sanghuangporus vaninii]
MADSGKAADKSPAKDAGKGNTQANQAIKEGSSAPKDSTVIRSKSWQVKRMDTIPEEPEDIQETRGRGRQK